MPNQQPEPTDRISSKYIFVGAVPEPFFRSYFRIARIKGWSVNVNEIDLTSVWT